MKSGLTADEELFVGTTRRFLQDAVPTSVLRELRDAPEGYEPGYWKTGAELGWTSMLVTEEHGGGSISGNGLGDLALVAHEFGRAAAPGPLLSTNVVASALSRVGGESATEALGALCAGEAVASWCWSEPRPHSGLGDIAAVAERSGTGWVLSGVKSPVEHGAQAGLFLVTARAEGGLVQLLVPATQEGVTVTQLRSIDVTRRFARVAFDGVQVPATAVLGEPGHAAAEAERQLCEALVIQVAEMAGAMDRAFELTVAWAADRYSFGRPLASYQALKHRFADMKLWLETSHALVDAATEAAAGDDADRATELASVAKSYIGDHGPELCQDCVQMHGGIGLTFEHDLHFSLRRVALGHALIGTPREHRLRLTNLLERRNHERKATDL
ncbi:acyl-CoA dehydrogenase family protein [Pseudofrankia inefficax]|uniref:Acyl-CoA dehydrogenase domain-containing protein n=1 Tax=Pseudofrankia inefficax (strain DSM 45817 / CECT 9037 / DDB 130130 / EuI1c) TaxID=298654 RepID=E3IW18_PSEI1|nr:acyl-CoA dehydrogenase family protein [Pseudofrankia inefficax]ADP84946.1 acyl-CoA dehydrogenase domain-containing protein [Pseudofrankia inefficax]